MADRPEHDNADEVPTLSPLTLTGSGDGGEAAVKGDWQGYDLSILSAVLDG